MEYSENVFYQELKNRFIALLEQHALMDEAVFVSTKSLSPEEAIGITRRKDFPIITGKDVMIQADCLGALGQAFTDAPSAFRGSLKDICELDLSSDSHNRGLFIAVLNAVMKYLKRVDCTVHCRTDGPELCAVDAAEYLRLHYENPQIVLVGYQPALLEQLSKIFQLRVLDLNENNIGQLRYGVLVEDGGDDALRVQLCKKADLILCTGSTVCNGTIVNFLPYKDKTLFFGTSLAGAAELMDLPRLCFADRYPSTVSST